MADYWEGLPVPYVLSSVRSAIPESNAVVFGIRIHLSCRLNNALVCFAWMAATAGRFGRSNLHVVRSTVVRPANDYAPARPAAKSK